MDNDVKESYKDIFRILNKIQYEIEILENRIKMLENLQRINDKINHRDGVLRY